MFHGQLEFLDPQGAFTGWAYDDEAPAAPLLVTIVGSNGSELAMGLAHRCRRDLVAQRRGVGWCGFRLLSWRPTSVGEPGPYYLVASISNRVIQRVASLPARPAEVDPEVRSPVYDPFRVDALWQLDACGDVLAAFVMRRGAETFVRRAFHYALGRFADGAEIERGARQLTETATPPLELLVSIATALDPRPPGRPLAAPISPEFPFV